MKADLVRFEFGGRLQVIRAAPKGQDLRHDAPYDYSGLIKGLILVKVEFSIWIASKRSWAHLVKSIPMEAVPRVGEYIKFSTTNYDYVPWKVTQVTYLEDRSVEVWTELLNNIDNRKYSFDDEDEFQDCLEDFKSNGWEASKGIRENRHIK